MPRLSLLLVPLVWLCLLPLLSQAAEPVGGEQIAWRELVVQTPPGWFRVPEQEGDGGDMAVFAAKSDGTLAVVTLSVHRGRTYATPCAQRKNALPIPHCKA